SVDRAASTSLFLCCSQSSLRLRGPVPTYSQSRRPLRDRYCVDRDASLPSLPPSRDDSVPVRKYADARTPLPIGNVILGQDLADLVQWNGFGGVAASRNRSGLKERVVDRLFSCFQRPFEQTRDRKCVV